MATCSLTFHCPFFSTSTIFQVFPQLVTGLPSNHYYLFSAPFFNCTENTPANDSPPRSLCWAKIGFVGLAKVSICASCSDLRGLAPKCLPNLRHWKLIGRQEGCHFGQKCHFCSSMDSMTASRFPAFSYVSDAWSIRRATRHFNPNCIRFVCQSHYFCHSFFVFYPCLWYCFVFDDISVFCLAFCQIICKTDQSWIAALDMEEDFESLWSNSRFWLMQDFAFFEVSWTRFLSTRILRYAFMSTHFSWLVQFLKVEGLLPQFVKWRMQNDF